MLASAGTKLGPYEIVALIGAGGMGEVYRARDPRLGRDVALKICHQTFSERFEREARAIAALNHPNICQIYDVGPNYLVMELIEGAPPTGPFPIEIALDYARQIAEALEAAHGKGVVHRDLKPSNLRITPEGVVKVLDFGLAAVVPPCSDPSDLANSPTLTIEATRRGVILGTAGYMSPEQAKGKPVDRRADIWSFGVIFFEMLTGHRLFQGETISDTLADVLRAPIEFNTLPPETPPKIRDLLAQCLERNVKNRLHDIADARILIESILRGSSPETPNTLSSRHKTNWARVAVLLALSLALVSLGLFLSSLARQPHRPLMQLAVDLGPEALPGLFSTAAISPDGMRLVFPAKSPDGPVVLATRLLSENKPSFLPGTENGRDPFFSPDGNWIGFFADRKMKKISVQGGAPVILCDASDSRGADWGQNGKIIAALSTQGALSLVSSESSAPQGITKIEGSGLSHRWPQFLPGDENVLFTISSSTVAFEDSDIVTASLRTGQVKIIVRGGYFGRYIPTSKRSGHLLYVHDGVLFGVRFDPANQVMLGTPIPLLDNVAADPNSGAGQFSFSGSGTFIYRIGKIAPHYWTLGWLNDSGQFETLISRPGIYLHPRFSRDGQRLALVQGAGIDARIIVYDLRRDTMSRLASSVQQPGYPTWTPDGKHLVFGYRAGAGFGIGWIRADGAGAFQPLLVRSGVINPYSFFPDGKRLAYYEADPDGRYDIWTVPLDIGNPDSPKAGTPQPFMRTPANERHPAVSPDGRWIAYSSDESGRTEVYVQPFPGAGRKWQISNDNGQLPIWSRSSRQLFFQNTDHRIMVVNYSAADESFVAGKPRLWSDFELHYPSALNYDLAPDGRRFVILPELRELSHSPEPLRVAFMLNFFDELRRRTAQR